MSLIEAHLQEARSGGYQSPHNLEGHQVIETQDGLSALLAVVTQNSDLWLRLYFEGQQITQEEAKKLLS